MQGREVVAALMMAAVEAGWGSRRGGHEEQRGAGGEQRACIVLFSGASRCTISHTHASADGSAPATRSISRRSSRSCAGSSTQKRAATTPDGIRLPRGRESRRGRAWLRHPVGGVGGRAWRRTRVLGRWVTGRLGKRAAEGLRRDSFGLPVAGRWASRKVSVGAALTLARRTEGSLTRLQ